MLQALSEFRWIDLIDILIVTFVVYRLILLVKGTRAERMLWGLAVIVLVYFVSQRMELFTLHWILSNFLSSIVIIVIVVFQRDIRRVLVQVGRTSFFSRGLGLKEELLEELTKAAFQMSKNKTGALIVLERDVGLGDYLDVGVEVDAKVSSEMVLSIFNPTSPVHDGAAIIRKGRISRVGCFLPLARDPEISKSLGTRHRAALGLTEDTDAVIIVVSEETGEVSLVVNREIIRDLDAGTFLKKLRDIFITSEEKRMFPWEKGY
ncbi:MAG: diadenylate cyclase CdaA [Deltaproteobacteria bacterium]